MTSQFQPGDPDFRARVERSFAEQSVMQLIGASLVTVDPGRTVIELPYREDLCQQVNLEFDGQNPRFGRHQRKGCITAGAVHDRRRYSGVNETVLLGQIALVGKFDDDLAGLHLGQARLQGLHHRLL